MIFLKENLFKILIAVLITAAVVVGIWYWQPQKELPAFHPLNIAFGDGEETIFTVSYEGLGVFNSESEKLSIVNGSFGPNSFLVAGQDGRIYIIDGDSNRLSIYQDGKFIKDISGFPRPRHIFLDEAGNKIFIYNKDDYSLSVVSSEDYRIIKTIKNIGDIYGGFFDKKSNRLYLAESYKNRLAVVNGGDFNVKYIPVGQVPNIKDVGVFDEVNQRLYILGREDHKIWVVDTNKNEVVKSIETDSDYVIHMTSNAKKDKLYLADTYNHRVLIFDVKNNSIKKIQLSPLLYPMKVLADEESNRLYVHNEGRVSEITVLDMNGKAIKNIPVGYFISDFKFSDKTKTLYATSNVGGFMMTLKNDKEKFYYKQPEVVEKKLNWPNLLRIGPLSRRLYVLSDFANNYLAHDSKSLDLIDELPLGGGPYSILTIGESAAVGKTYIINKGINEVWYVEFVDGKFSVLKKIKLDRNALSGVGLNKSRKIYITSDDSIIVINAEKDEITKTISAGSRSTVIGVDQERGVVYIRSGDNLIEEIDGSSDTVKRSLKIGMNKIWFDAKNSRFYVLGPDNKSLSIIDQKNLKAVKTINLDNSYQEMVVTPWAGKLYLLDSLNNKLLVLDNASLKQLVLLNLNDTDENTIKTPSATSLYMNEKTGMVYIVHRYGRITVVDAKTNKIIKTIPLNYGANPVSLQVDPDLNRLYVANKWLNQVQVYSLTDYTLQAEIDAQGNTHWLKPQQ